MSEEAQDPAQDQGQMVEVAEDPGPDSVVIGYMTQTGHMDPGFAICLSQMQNWDAHNTRRIRELICFQSSPRITSVRNRIVNQFLDAHVAPWLLMIDADMLVSADCVERLLRVAHPEDRPVVSALYFGGQVDGDVRAHCYMAGTEPGKFVAIDASGAGQMKPGEFEGIVQCAAVGAGCLMVHRDVLVAMRDAYQDTGASHFAEAYAKGEEVGEDVTFCMRLTAMGVPIFCDTEHVVGHSKPGVVDDVEFRKNLSRRQNGATDDEVTGWYMSRRGLVPRRPEPGVAPALDIVKIASEPRPSLLAATAVPRNREQRRAFERSRQGS